MKIWTETATYKDNAIAHVEEAIKSVVGIITIECEAILHETEKSINRPHTADLVKDTFDAGTKTLDRPGIPARARLHDLNKSLDNLLEVHKLLDF